MRINRRSGWLSSVLLATGLVVLANVGFIPVAAQTNNPTPTPAATALVTGGQILVASVSGGAVDPSLSVRTAITTLTGYKLTTVSVTQPIQSLDDATTAAKGSNALAIIWLEPSQKANSPSILHVTALQRQQLQSHILARREHVTNVGLLTLADDLQLPLVAKLDSKTVGAYVTAQLYLALADDANALNALATAHADLAANTGLGKNSSVVSDEIVFETAYLNAVGDPGQDAKAAAAFNSLGQSAARPALKALAYANLAALYFNQGLYLASGTAASTALKIDNTSEAARLNQSVFYNWQGNNQAAIDELTAVIARDPQNLFALNDLGWFNYLGGNFTDAEDDLGRVLTIDPNFVDAYVNRSAALLQDGYFAEAIAEASTAISLDSSYARAFSTRGTAFYAAGAPREAVADLTEAIALGENDHVVYNNRGDAWRALGEFDKAITDYSTAISINATDPIPYIGRGEAYLARNDFYNAVFDESLAIHYDKQGNYPSTYFYRAQAYRGLQLWDKAIADYQKYVQIAPDGRYVGEANNFINAMQSGQTATPSPPTNGDTGTNL